MVDRITSDVTQLCCTRSTSYVPGPRKGGRPRQGMVTTLSGRRARRCLPLPPVLAKARPACCSPSLQRAGDEQQLGRVRKYCPPALSVESPSPRRLVITHRGGQGKRHGLATERSGLRADWLGGSA